ATDSVRPEFPACLQTQSLAPAWAQCARRLWVPRSLPCWCRSTHLPSYHYSSRGGPETLAHWFCHLQRCSTTPSPPATCRGVQTPPAPLPPAEVFNHPQPPCHLQRCSDTPSPPATCRGVQPPPAPLPPAEVFNHPQPPCHLQRCSTTPSPPATCRGVQTPPAPLPPAEVFNHPQPPCHLQRCSDTPSPPATCRGVQPPPAPLPPAEVFTPSPPATCRGVQPPPAPLPPAEVFNHPQPPCHLQRCSTTPSHRHLLLFSPSFGPGSYPALGGWPLTGVNRGTGCGMTICVPSVQSEVTSGASFPSTPSSYPSLLCPEAEASQSLKLFISRKQ
ncbi:hypothetical protein P7K49_035588, partial [Saguinus oedipus]